MKTKLKKFLILLLVLVVIPLISNGQDRKLEVNPAPNIEGVWVLQNPKSYEYTQMNLGYDGKYTIFKHDVLNNKTSEERGIYKIQEDVLLLRTNGEVIWWENHIVSISGNILLLYGKPNNDMYARLGTLNDTMSPIYKTTVTISSGSMNYNSVYTPQATPTTCAGCHGCKRCAICSGIGETTNPYTGTIGTCSACGGDGICHICHGIGYY